MPDEVKKDDCDSYTVDVTVLKAKGLFSLQDSPEEEEEVKLITKVAVLLLDGKRTESKSDAFTTTIQKEKKTEDDGKEENEKEKETTPAEGTNCLKLFETTYDFKASHTISKRVEKQAFIDDLFTESILVSVYEEIDGEEKCIGTASISAEEIVKESKVLEKWIPLSLLTEEFKARFDEAKFPSEKAYPSVLVRICISELLLNAEQIQNFNLMTIETTGMFNLPKTWEDRKESTEYKYKLDYHVPHMRSVSVESSKINFPSTDEEENDDFQVIDAKNANANTAKPHIRFSPACKKFYLSTVCAKLLKALNSICFSIKVVNEETGDTDHIAIGRMAFQKFLLKPGAQTLVKEVPIVAFDAGEKSDILKDAATFLTVKITLDKPLVEKRPTLSVNDLLPEATSLPQNISSSSSSGGASKPIGHLPSNLQRKMNSLALKAEALKASYNEDVKEIRKTEEYEKLKEQLRTCIIQQMQKYSRWKFGQGTTTTVMSEASKKSREISDEEVQSILAGIRHQAIKRAVPNSCPEMEMLEKVACMRYQARNAERFGDIHISHSIYLARIALVGQCEGTVPKQVFEKTMALCWYDYGGFCSRGTSYTKFQELSLPSLKNGNPGTSSSLFRTSGDRLYAAACFKKALEYHQSFLPATMSLCALLCEDNKVEIAYKYIKEVTAALKTTTSKSDHPLVLGMMYVVMELLEDDAEADGFLKKALSNMDPNPNADMKRNDDKDSLLLSPTDWDLKGRGKICLNTQDESKVILYLVRYFQNLHLVRLPLYFLSKIWEDASKFGSVDDKVICRPKIPSLTDQPSCAKMLYTYTETARAWIRAGQAKLGHALQKYLVESLQSSFSSLVKTDNFGENCSIAATIAEYGYSLIGKGDREEAVKLLEIAFSFHESTAIRNSLVTMYLKTKQYVKAKELLIEQKDKNAYNVAFLALAMLKTSEPHFGTMVATATALNPRNPVVWAISCICALEKMRSKECGNVCRNAAEKEARVNLQQAFQCELCQPAWLLEQLSAACVEADLDDLGGLCMKRMELK